jgi:hypothetical protein
MALPGDITKVPVIGTWLDGQGNPCSGKVVFSPRIATRFVDTASSVVIMPERFTVTLDNTGSISTSVIATDAAALVSTAGFMWQVAVLLNDAAGQQLSPYSFTMVAPGAGGTINISTPPYAVTGNSVGLPAM